MKFTKTNKEGITLSPMAPLPVKESESTSVSPAFIPTIGKKKLVERTQYLNPIDKEEVDRRSKQLVDYKKNVNSYSYEDVPADMVRIIAHPFTDYNTLRKKYKEEYYRPGNEKERSSIMVDDITKNTVRSLQNIGIAEFGNLLPSPPQVIKNLTTIGSKSNLISNIISGVKDASDLYTGKTADPTSLAFNTVGALVKTGNINTGDVVQDIINGTTNFRNPSYILNATKDASSHISNAFDLWNREPSKKVRKHQKGKTLPILKESSDKTMNNNIENDSSLLKNASTYAARMDAISRKNIEEIPEYKEFLKTNPDKRWSASAERSRFKEYYSANLLKELGLPENFKSSDIKPPIESPLDKLKNLLAFSRSEKEKTLKSFQTASEIGEVGGVKYNTPEYNKAFKENRLAAYNPSNNTYVGPMLPEVEVKASNLKMQTNIHNAQKKFLNTALDLTSAPQKSLVESVTGKYKAPSEVWGFKNPGIMGTIGNFAMDAVIDPTNLIGAGILTKALNLNRGAKALKTVGISDDIYSAIRTNFVPQPLERFNNLTNVTPPNNRVFDLQELRKSFHNNTRFLSTDERSYLNRHGVGNRENYITAPQSNSRALFNYSVPNPFSSMVTEPARINPSNQGLIRNLVLMEQPHLRNVFTNEAVIQDYINIINSNASNSQYINRDLMREFGDEVVTTKPSKSQFKGPTVYNQSFLSKDDLLARSDIKNKDFVTNMSDNEFKKTALKPDGEVVMYNSTDDLKQVTTDDNGRYFISDGTRISYDEYRKIFNENLEELNKIIKKNNKSGRQYTVKELTPEGNLRFEFPEYLKPLGDNKFELLPKGESSWTTTIKPGKWKGQVEDIINTDYYKSIPGIEMSVSSRGVFNDRKSWKGTGTYEAINEYLKLLDLGRVKPGFNSQTDSSFNVWKRFINSNKAVGFHASHDLLYGIMRSYAPFITSAGLAAPLLKGSLGTEKPTKPQISKRQQGGLLSKDISMLSTNNVNDTSTTGMTGMMKSVMALASEFKNPTARRMTNMDSKNYTFNGTEYDGALKGGKGNVFVSTWDNLVTPQIQDYNGVLKFVIEPWSKQNAKKSYNQSLKFNSDSEANYFGENYKNIAPMMNFYK